MTLNGYKHELIYIDDIFAELSIDNPIEYQVTLFYVNSKNRDKEIHFIIILN